MNADGEGRTEEQILERSLWRSLAWIGGSKWAVQLLTWGSTLVVARLLAPSDYGIIGLASLYVGVISLVADSGIGTSVVVLRSLTPRQISQMHALSGAIGTGLLLLSCAFAGLVSRFFETPELMTVIVVMSFPVAFLGWQSVPDAVVQRQLRFRALAVRDTVRGIATAVCTVVLAFLGFGYWAIAGGIVIGAAVALVMTFFLQRVTPVLPRLGEIRYAVTFSSYTLGATLAWYAYSNADFFVAGKMFDTAALGAYTLAWTLASVSVEKVAALVGRVTPSYFGAAQREPTLLRSYLRNLTQTIALLALPVSAGGIL